MRFQFKEYDYSNVIESNLIYLGAPSMRSTAYVELKSAFRRKTGLASGRSVRITNRSKMLQEKALQLGTYKQTNSSRTTNSLALCWDPRCSCIAGCPFPLPWPLLLPLCCPASVVSLLCFALFFLSPPSPCFFSLLCLSNLKLASCRGSQGTISPTKFGDIVGYGTWPIPCACIRRAWMLFAYLVAGSSLGLAFTP